MTNLTSSRGRRRSRPGVTPAPVVATPGVPAPGPLRLRRHRPVESAASGECRVGKSGSACPGGKNATGGAKNLQQQRRRSWGSMESPTREPAMRHRQSLDLRWLPSDDLDATSPPTNGTANKVLRAARARHRRNRPRRATHPSSTTSCQILNTPPSSPACASSSGSRRQPRRRPTSSSAVHARRGEETRRGRRTGGDLPAHVGSYGIFVVGRPPMRCRR